MKNNQNNSAMNNQTSSPSAEADRRAFLAACGKFAAVTPPSVALLLSTSLTSPAIAYSGANGHHDNGHHYGWDK